MCLADAGAGPRSAVGLSDRPRTGPEARTNSVLGEQHGAARAPQPETVEPQDTTTHPSHPIQRCHRDRPYVATDRVFLRRDLRLVRAAIMYADHVQLISPGAQMIQQIAPLRNATGRDAAVMLRSLDDTTVRTFPTAKPPGRLAGRAGPVAEVRCSTVGRLGRVYRHESG